MSWPWFVKLDCEEKIVSVVGVKVVIDNKGVQVAMEEELAQLCQNLKVQDKLVEGKAKQLGEWKQKQHCDQIEIDILMVEAEFWQTCNTSVPRKTTHIYDIIAVDMRRH